MSRNKDIEFLHKMTQKPYSVCRSIMKKNHWDLVEAFIDCDVLGSVVTAAKKVIEAFQKSFIPIFEALADQSRILLNQYKLLDELEDQPLTE